MKETEYDSLGNIEAIQKRPGMYIGDTESPNQLITEAIDNMLDEVANGHANQCSVEITDEKQCWISDNGRGIKSYNMTLSDGRVENSIVALCSVTHTGSKFDNEDYKTLIGMHGVGLVAINALSNWLVVRTRDRDNRTKVHEFIFQNSEFINSNIYENIEDDESWSTIIGFQANPKYFRSDEYNIEEIRNRLILSQSKFNRANFYLNKEEIEKYPFDEYVRNCLNLEKSDDLFRLSYENQKEKIEVFITYTNDFDVNVLGDVNLRTCDGTYLTSFQTLLKKLIGEKLDKKFKKVSDSLLTLGLKLYISLTVPEPQFDSQTKTRMTLNVREDLIVPLTNQINWLLGQGVLDIIQYNIENKLKKSIVPKQTASKKMISVENKLRDCVKIPGDVLYIVEGESALGTIKQIRNSKTEAIFPVKGKVLNVESASVDKIKNNKEVSDLLEALGPKEKRRYKKVKLLMDADSDGAHISVLLITLFNKFVSDMIKEGRISIIYPPLYGVTIKKKFIPIYKFEDTKQYSNHHVMRFKGLGEMNSSQLKKVIDSKMEYILEYPGEKKANFLMDLIRNSEYKRQLVQDDRCVTGKILEKILEKNKQDLLV